ncbi:MAG TPA: L,D-transpeptidase family protein [Usitatibacter sp.]|nr:L,D-transpeptidase family protein [Usitatibacter sp.]
MNAGLLLRNGLRLAPRVALAGLCMSAAAIADGGGSLTVSVRAGPALANEIEGSLVRAIVGLSEAGLKSALGEIDKAIDRNPNYKLAHLVRGDMLMARAGKPVAFASLSASSASTAPLQDEARVRLNRYLDGPRVDDLPAPVLQLAQTQAHVLVIDTSRSRLFVYANDLGRPRYVTDFYISLGKNGVEKTREGDQKTPLGVYRIISAREKLPDFYGPGAYPLDYPNDWDKIQGRRGHGIWLHGTPSETYARPPWATDGCIVLTNDDLAKLTRYVDVSRTPVVIGQAVQWQASDRWEGDRAAFLADFNRWKVDWESRDLERYFGHYSADFRTERRGLGAWKSQKRKTNSGKAWIKVGVENMSVFAYPGAPNTMMVTFEQDYRSNNLSNRTVKRQYWVREAPGWRIVHESVIS